VGQPSSSATLQIADNLAADPNISSEQPMLIVCCSCKALFFVNSVHRDRLWHTALGFIRIHSHERLQYEFRVEFEGEEGTFRI